MSGGQPDLFSQASPSRRPRFDADAFGTGGHSEGTVAVDLQDRAGHQTMAARVAAFFKARPNVWIDGRDLMTVAGSYGWRTRISDCRRSPFQMRIDNRQRRVGQYTISEYMYLPNAEGGAA